MKINWGTGIVLAFVFFICFILYFVITMSTNAKYEYELVTENYYQQELAFQEDINKKKNAAKLREKVRYLKTDAGLEIVFPKQIPANEISGKVLLYRPSNKKLDWETNINLTTPSLVIPKEKLLEGRWNIRVDWRYKNIDYLYTEKIIY